MSYNLSFSQHFGISAGAMILYAPFDFAGWSDSSRNSSYYIDDDNTKRFNLFLSTFYSQPLFRSTGVYANWSVSFEPIPYEYISLERRMNNDAVSENIGKYQFNGFSPGKYIEYLRETGKTEKLYDKIYEDNHSVHNVTGGLFSILDPEPESHPEEDMPLPRRKKKKKRRYERFI